jgi:hypothetical protein
MVFVHVLKSPGQSLPNEDSNGIKEKELRVTART